MSDLTIFFIIATGLIALAVIIYAYRKKPTPTSKPQPKSSPNREPARSAQPQPNPSAVATSPTSGTPPNREPVTPTSAAPVTLAGSVPLDLRAVDPSLLDAKIMLVDDEPTTIEVLQMLLEEAGYRHFITTSQAEQAMEIIDNENPDVVLTDLHMPEVNGFDLVQAMRAHIRLQHLPVIMLTSDDDAKTKLHALQLGATDFLSKPVDPSELTLRLRNTLAAKAHQDRLANYDAVTGLPNRRLLMNHLDRVLQHAARTAKTGAILHISLDRFKDINETLGHLAGDLLLKTIAQRLESVLQTQPRHRTSNGFKPILSRMSGAEFIVLCPEVDGNMHADRLARHLLEALTEPFHVDNHDLVVAAGIGIAMFPADGDHIETLLKHVEAATHHTKQHGGNTHAFYSHDMKAKALERFSLESQLRNALERGELQLYYQPQVEVKTGQMLGVEAILYWHHPELGALPPEQFIPLAEDRRLITTIEDWALHTACQQVKTWQALGFGLNLALNVSGQQLHDPHFKRTIYRALAKARLAPQNLTLEFAESTIMQNASEHVEALRVIKEMGIRLAIDHFGKGYSSLIYLDQFPLDELKIDSAFLQAINAGTHDAPIITAIIAMAHSLGLTTVAEGVEIDKQLTFLRDRGCDLYQGRRYSPPVPEEAFAALLTRA